jgi:two-component system, OmpR family, manganese sensing sensor histidine kinase
MFRRTQHQLLSLYILVLVAVLGTFALAVRIMVMHGWQNELIAQLTALAEGAAASTDERDFQVVQPTTVLAASDAVNLVIHNNQTLEWWSNDGKIVTKQGLLKFPLGLPSNSPVQFQPGNPPLQAFTIPVVSNTTHRQIGYVRAIHSLAASNAAIQRTDISLGGGVVVALLVSIVGGVLLTRQSMQPIEESFQRLQQFTADASHEFRGPLMAIKSNVSVALRHADHMRPGDLEKFQAIASASNQMAHLTDDLLMLARSDDPITEQRWRTVDLVQLLQQLERIYAAQAIAKQITLTIDVPDSLFVRGDAVQLHRLYGNLLENAINYTPPQGKVQLTASNDQATAVVTIHDSGIGIAADQLSRIFDRFWRADSARSYWNGGSGLGLTIVQRLVQLHQGRVVVKSKVGCGSCFTVYLPLLMPSALVPRVKNPWTKLRQSWLVLRRYLFH